MNIEKALFWYVATLVTLSLIAWQVVFIRGQFLGMGFPYNTFLFIQSAQFGDFTVFDPLIRAWLDGEITKITSFPGRLDGDPNLVLYAPVTTYGFLFFHLLYPDNPVYAYLLTVLLVVCIAGAILGYVFRHLSIAKIFWVTIILTILTSYPFMIMFDRANMEGLLFPFLLIGAVNFVNRRFFISGVFFAIAASMKYYHGILLLLLLSKGKYKEFVFSIFFMLSISVIAAYGLNGSVSNTYCTIYNGLSWFKEVAVLSRQTPNFEHSLFGLLKQMLFIFEIYSQTSMAAAHHLYPFVVISGFVLLYIFKIVKLPFLNQLFVLNILGILLPFFSGDYTLIHVYVPWGVFMVFLAYDAESTGFTTKQALNILIPCAIIFTPQSYLIVEGIGGFGGQIKTLVLLYLLIVVLQNPMRMKGVD